MKIHWHTTRDPGDASFIVRAGEVFDADAFAEAFEINRAELDPDDVHWAQDAAARLMDGQVLVVAPEPQTNERGNTITRAFHPLRERYFYDNKLHASDGWIQYDTEQDAPYFGVWVNPRTLQTMTFAEGDEIAVQCASADSYHAELADMAAFYGPPPPARGHRG